MIPADDSYPVTPSSLYLSVLPDQPLKIFQADIPGVFPDFLFPFVSLCHGNMLPYMVALRKRIYTLNSSPTPLCVLPFR